MADGSGDGATHKTVYQHGVVEQLVGFAITRGQPLDHTRAIGVGLQRADPPGAGVAQAW